MNFFFPKQGSAITLHRAQYLSSANETQSKKKNPLLFPCNKLRQIPHLRNTRRVQTMLRTLHTKFLVEHILLAFFKKKIIIVLNRGTIILCLLYMQNNYQCWFLKAQSSAQNLNSRLHSQIFFIYHLKFNNIRDSAVSL